MLPLKEMHVQFFLNVLLPLYKPSCLPKYHRKLSNCVFLFLEKDPSLTTSVIESLLRFWPKVNSEKELIFLDELENILHIINPFDFQEVMVWLFIHISKCATSLHEKVAKRALEILQYLNNEYIVAQIIENLPTI